jgi:hypothetical protein
MPEIAREALELAVRAADAGEDEEITVHRARAFYEFLRAPVGASAQESATASAYVAPALNKFGAVSVTNL